MDDGWAFDRTIDEVYKQTKIDAYHELTSILE